MYHYMVFVSGSPTFGWASQVGWVGVDLFFVLSGYLIANQLFSGVKQGKRLSLPSFYLRRGLRTWPAFWLVLCAYFVFPSVMGGKTPPPLWAFLTFTQNLGLRAGTAFSHAWSLCIEEQFYFVLPLVLVLALRLGTRRWQGWVLLGGLLVLGMASRALLWQQYGAEEQAAGYMSNIYYSTLCRFDEFIPGIAVALVKHFHPDLWQRAMRNGQKLLLAAVGSTALVLYAALRYYYIDGVGYGFFMTAFGYSLLALCFALLVAAALSPASALYRARVPGAYHLALWSYSIYLTHKPIANIIRNHAGDWGVSPMFTVATVVAVSLLVGALLYYLVEKPFMMLRDRLVPSNFSESQGAGVTELVAPGAELDHARRIGT
jgi:peptidoglycan/LPS O-acetylase OafA/YrhL